MKNIIEAKKLSYNAIRSEYKSYLLGENFSRNTIGTMTGDTFYLWNNGSKELFWNVVSSDDFESTARDAVEVALTNNSSGNVTNLVSGYVSHLRRFRAWVMSDAFSAIKQEKDDVTVLKEFLLDIECLDPLTKWTNTFNMFDILKISRTEIRHSNMLAWLLNPNENHGLDDAVIRGFIQYVVEVFRDQDVFTLLLMDTHDFVVQREWHNIDLLVTSAREKFVLCIENKIDTGEHDNQLNRYKKLIDDYYPDYHKMFVYLSPSGAESTDTDNWCSMGYDEVLAIIEKAKSKVKLLPDAELLIQNYIDTIRRDIVGDEELARICAEIYAKHQKALDLIFENKPDKAAELATVLRKWCTEKTEAGELEIVADKCVKSYTRFKTKIMSELLPDATDGSLSGWGTPNYYFYEILNDKGEKFNIQFCVSSKDIPDDLRAICDRINEKFPSKQNKVNWQWRTHYSTKAPSRVGDEINIDKIYEQLDKKLEELKAFEKELSTYLQAE